MGITRSLLFCSLYGGALRACWGCSSVHYIPIFFLALAASLWIFCLLHWLLWGGLWSLQILFLWKRTTLHADLSMTVHLLNEICFCLGTLEMGVTRSLFMPLFSSDVLPHLPKLVLWPFLVAVCRWTGYSPTVTWTKILWSMLPFRLW